jgi:transmembrane sensor
MNEIKAFKNKQSIQDEAAQWVVRVDGDSLSEAERETFAIWLKNPSHKKEFIELANIWGNLDVLQEVAELVQSDEAGSEKIATVNVGGAEIKLQRSNRLGNYAVAASLAMMAIAFLVRLNLHTDKHNLVANELLYTTNVGEQRDIALEDGSQLKLNTNSVVKVNFSAGQRSIYLQQGEVNFNVAKDKSRPFIVYVGEGSVTAVGTVFDIRFQQGVADVVVTEGVVKVAASATENTGSANALQVPKNSLATAVASLAAGQKARFDAQKISELGDIEAVEIERKLSWQSGMLSFADTPLREVVDEVSRYTSTRIVIDDADVANIPVGGYFKAGEINSILEVLQLSFGIKVTRLTNDKILLSKSDHFSNH